MIPGLQNANFVKYGVMHRNTYINSTYILDNTYNMKENKRIFFAGQITGVEGYVESICSGFVAGINAAKLYIIMKEEGDKEDNLFERYDAEKITFSKETVIGALAEYGFGHQGKIPDNIVETLIHRYVDQM